ncbi:MAG: glycosyltransferase family 2 protein [Ktedonobacteraceae bacterium]|nr:glycosyltransferase family 2 protein [Ktedonobacteraceae bacterium]
MSPDTKLDVSVIICAYTEKRWDDLVAAVKSIQQQTVLPGEIIVVIDHNPPLLERVRQSIAGIVAVENSECAGLSGARNSGIAVARGSLIAFLDDDAVAEPDWLAHLVDCCKDPYVLGAGGRVEPYWLERRHAWLPEEFYWVVGCSYRGQPEKRAVVRNPFGGCMCVRREVFAAVGNFKNNIGRIGTHPMGGEETELCIRASQHWPEKSFLYEPEARIHHRIPSARTRWRYFSSRCYAEGLSKALVAADVGAKDGLASERRYVFSTLPQGVMRGLRDGLWHADFSSLQRAGAIVAGLSITTAGFLRGKISLWFATTKTARLFSFARTKNPAMQIFQNVQEDKENVAVQVEKDKLMIES